MDTQQLLDALDVQAWTAAPNGLLTFVNAFTAAYFGRSREQLVGEGWQNMLHAADLPLAVESGRKRSRQARTITSNSGCCAAAAMQAV